MSGYGVLGNVNKQGIRHEKVIIIGGGVAGLAVALRSGGTVLERAPRVGGRVRTVVDSSGTASCSYDAGPWRIHRTHHRLLALVGELGLTTRQTTSSMRPREIVGGALSQADRDLLDLGVAGQRRRELETGYEGFHAGPVQTYDVRHPEQGHYLVLDGGFQVLVDALRRRIGDDHIVCDVRVTDVAYDPGSQLHLVRARRRRGSGFEDATYVAPTVVGAVPPRVMLGWRSVGRWLRAPLHSVGTLALCHIYGQLQRRDTKELVRVPPMHLVLPVSRLAQVISGDHDRSWFQLSYSGTQRAEFWYRLHRDDPARFRATLLTDLRRALRGRLGDVAVDDVELGPDVRVHFWPHAVHYWRPVFGFPDDADRIAERTVRPHAGRLPRFFMCGEAFSGHHHGWIEGALETAERVYRAMTVSDEDARKDSDEPTIWIEDRPVRVDAWKHVHPGSRQAIENHLGERATELFEHIHGSSPEAWATVFALSGGV